MPALLGFPGWGPLGFVRPSGLSVFVSHYPTVGPSSLVSGSTLLVRLDRGLLITIEGFDDTPAHVDLDSQKFTAVRGSDVIFTVGPNPLDPLNPNQALITPVAIGTGALAIRADGDPNSNNDPLSLDLNIQVYAIAVDSIITYAIPPTANPIPIPTAGFFDIPMNEVAQVVATGIDQFGGVALLRNQLFSVSVSDKFTIETTADPNVVLLHPVATGSRTLKFDADGDGYGPESAPLTQENLIVNIKPAVATHMVASGATVIP